MRELPSPRTPYRGASFPRPYGQAAGSNPADVRPMKIRNSLKSLRGRHRDNQLVPGMPVEAFMQLGDRSVISYLTKPLTDQIAKAWRER